MSEGLADFISSLKRSAGAQDKGVKGFEMTALAPRRVIAKSTAPALVLTTGQETARGEVLQSLKFARDSWAKSKIKYAHQVREGESLSVEHTLMGHAGTGKTTLLRKLVVDLMEEGLAVAVTAPTNKAVSVIAANMEAAGIEIPCVTIYKLLGLKPGSDDEKRTPVKRIGSSSGGDVDVIIVDEASMVGAELLKWMRRELRRHFILYIGDPAQLPPVGETLSGVFETGRVSMLTEIMRQAAGNPIISLATDIRTMIASGRPDWNRFDGADLGAESGIFIPAGDAQAWIDDAFTSAEFEADNDFCRYLCYTNARVKEVNSRIRKLIYGETPTPFIKGERVLSRSTIDGQDENRKPVTIATNEEAIIHDVEPGMFKHTFYERPEAVGKNGQRFAALPGYDVEFQVWNVRLASAYGGEVIETRIPRHDEEYKNVCNRIAEEARLNHSRWFEFFGMADKIAKLQSVYAQTIHTSQGSTYGSVFLDMDDCLKNSKVVEMLQLLYVGCTRPQRALMLI